MTELIFYGGVNEIGGNKILVKTDNGSVFLDFGRRMSYTQNYFSEFLQARSKNALRDLVKLGVLPNIDGIYSPQLVDMKAIFPNAKTQQKVPIDEAPDYFTLEGVRPCGNECQAVDGIFVSHAHFDHIQDVSFLDPNMSLYCTEKTKILAKAMTDVSPSGVDDQYYEIKRDAAIREKAVSYKTLCPGEYECKEDEEEQKPIITEPKTKFRFTHEYTPKYRKFFTDPEGQIKGIKYKMIPVGHSVPGACSILLTLPDGKRLLYTGDFHFHGNKEPTLEEYIESIGQPVDILIIEGTRIKRENIIREEEVGRAIESDIAQTRGLVLINFGWKDLARFNTIHEASIRNKRTLVVSPKLAYLLFEMYSNFPAEYPDPRTMPNLRVYLKREGDLLYSKADYDKYKMGYLHFHGRNVAKNDRNIVRVAERLGIGGDPSNDKNPLPMTSAGEPYDYRELYSLATHHLDNGVRAYHIRKAPQQYVLMFTFWDANELFDLIPLDRNHDTKYICASTEPFSEEMEIDESKFFSWLDFFKVNYEWEYIDKEKTRRMFVRRHVSGHACRNELKEVIERIKPSIIIPVHTENPESFKEIFSGSVIFAKYGQPIQI